jgi:[acyl-carrier-protein] S-malonyltransferase
VYGILHEDSSTEPTHKLSTVLGLYATSIINYHINHYISYLMLAFIFPGQGSQTSGMLSDLAQQYSIIQETYQEASSVLGYDLWALVQNPADVALLNQTERTQPSLLAASVALWRIWQARGGSLPTIMAGHSLGEYSALVCADAIDYSDAISLVALRGRYMQEAVKEGEGAMAAIVGLDNEKVEEICMLAREQQTLSPANFNAIGQTVIAGDTAAIDRAILIAKGKGAKIAQKIPVSVPSHCSLMTPAAEKLSMRLEQINIKKPNIPVIHNMNVQASEQPEDIRHALVQQLSSPVRWVETIQQMGSLGIDQIIECGPGKVLTGLNKRIDATIATTPIQLTINDE